SLPVSSSGKSIGQYGQISLNIPVFMLQSPEFRYLGLWIFLFVRNDMKENRFLIQFGTKGHRIIINVAR
ncbi:MAG: hypothetical protein JXA81_06210, partial [Sedimentisphaerales bacterium]|nr:hypothetical protein [Sedimentisphaerales bacterium]